MSRKVISEKIRQLRLEKGPTQAKVAKHLGISRSAYTHYENGNRDLPIEYAISLSKFYKVSLDYLLGNQLNKLSIQTIDGVCEFSISIIDESLSNISCCNNTSNLSEKIHIPKTWLKDQCNNYFIILPLGNSMKDDYITNDSILLFKRGSTLNNRQIGIFRFNSEYYIRRFRVYENGTIILQSANKSFEDILVTEEDDFQIIGVLKKNIINY